MCSLRVVLGWQQLLETDEAAKPLIQHVCDALELKTHWDAADLTLYIESPAQGRHAALAPVPGLDDPGWQRAKRIVVAAKACLAGAGSPGAGQGEHDISVHVGVQPKESPGVSVSFSWRGWRQNRKLAALLLAEVADAAGLPPLGTRVAPAREPQVCVWISGEPTQPEAGWCTNIGEAIYRGLARFWASPVLTSLQAGILAGDRPIPLAVPSSVSAELPACQEAAEPERPQAQAEAPVAEEPYSVEEPPVYDEPHVQEVVSVNDEPQVQEASAVHEETPEPAMVVTSVEEPEEPHNDVQVIEAEKVLILEPVPATGIAIVPRPPVVVHRPRHARRPRVASVPMPAAATETCETEEPVVEPAPIRKAESIVEPPPLLIPEQTVEPTPCPAPAVPVVRVPAARSRVSTFQWQRTATAGALHPAPRSAPLTLVALFGRTLVLSRIR